MSSVLVVYGTGTGCTAGIAERIAATLSEKGAQVVVSDAKSAPTPKGFDAVLVGSGVRAAKWHKPVTQWVTSNSAALKKVPVAFFTTCLTMADAPEKADEVRAYTDPLVEETGVSPVDIGLFAGWHEPAKFTFVERTVLKMLKAPIGDFRDWDAIDGWTVDVAPKLGVVA